MFYIKCCTHFIVCSQSKLSESTRRTHPAHDHKLHYSIFLTQQQVVNLILRFSPRFDKKTVVEFKPRLEGSSRGPLSVLE